MLPADACASSGSEAAPPIQHAYWQCPTTVSSWIARACTQTTSARSRICAAAPALEAGLRENCISISCPTATASGRLSHHDVGLDRQRRRWPTGISSAAMGGDARSQSGPGTASRSHRAPVASDDRHGSQAGHEGEARRGDVPGGASCRLRVDPNASAAWRNHPPPPADARRRLADPSTIWPARLDGRSRTRHCGSVERPDKLDPESRG